MMKINLIFSLCFLACFDDVIGRDALMEYKIPVSYQVEPKNGNSNIKFSEADISMAIKKARKLNQVRKMNKNKLQEKGLTSKSVTPHQQVGLLEKGGIRINENARFAQDVINTLSKLLYTKLMRNGTLALPKIAKPRHPRCKNEKNSRYRNIDGECNNVKYGLWGTPFTAQKRFLPPHYDEDGMSPRPTTRMENAKALSQKLLHSWGSIKDNRLNAMSMQFGQFLNHDISFTPVASFINKKTNKHEQVKCCKDEANRYFEDCFPIMISKDDWFYKKTKVDCIEFVRSASAFNERNGVITYGSRQQMNQVTSFIDGSQIYGSNRKTRNELFDRKTGLMKTSTIHKHNDYLPQDSSTHCESANNNKCFKAGDDRVNTQLNLMVMHTVFLREHNRIANYFRNHTDWSGKKIFEETRRIVGAILQDITYNEYLPAILSKKIIKEYGLDISRKRTRYQSNVNPSIFNEFSTAAFRFGHSQVYHKLSMSDEYGDLGAKVKLTDSYFNPDQIYDRFSAIQEYVMGLFYERSLSADNEISPSLTRELFMKRGQKYGLDLGAINIQRGRDHGIATYYHYRQMLKGSPDFKDVMLNEKIEKLKEAYDDLDNVDLFVGGLYEKPLDDSAMGSTFNHMIASQFRNLMLGDRYFYSHENTGKAGFKDAQYKEIQKVSLASIMCHNANLPKHSRLQTHGCLQTCPSYMTACEDIEEIDLSVFLH